MRKRQILSCAQAVISEKGFHNAQIEDISSLAHISRPTIYQYFESKENLFLTLLTLYLDELYCELDEFHTVYLDNDDLQDDFEFSIRQRIIMLIDFICKDSQRGVIITRLGGGLGTPFTSIIKKIERIMIKALLQDLEMAKSRGFINTDVNLRFLANMILGAIFRTCFTFGFNEENSISNMNIVDMTDEIIRLVLNDTVTSAINVGDTECQKIRTESDMVSTGGNYIP